jgi:heme/copper-type cytochrome/quinol oxidase subunit 2
MNKNRGHFTTRRGFVAATGFGLVSLYLVWAGYGAAPLGFGAHGEEAQGHAGEHGGGHGDTPAGPSREEFRKLAQAFAEEYKLPDGSVQPRARGHHAGHDEGPMDIYLMAMQWSYLPAVLRLEAGVRYRFRMMAMDIAHGASVQLGAGARMIRLRPGVLVEQELSFAEPGEYLVYCTVYCGLPHDRMQGRIVVAERGAKH